MKRILVGVVLGMTLAAAWGAVAAEDQVRLHFYHPLELARKIIPRITIMLH